MIRRTRSGKAIIANKPEFDENREFSAGQMAQQKAFKRAICYAKRAQTRLLYAQLAKGTGASAHKKATANWFGKPEVLAIDASGWTDEIGQALCIEAQDDTKVTRVTMVIHRNGTIQEQGEAVLSERDGSLWTYVTTTQVTPCTGSFAGCQRL